MALPGNVRVKLSSEAAGAISITPVVVQEMPLRELIEHMLGITGKDAERVREILLRGTMVSGASRFRWAGWEVDRISLGELLDSFPDSEPGRPFNGGKCVRAILRGARQAIEIPREVGSRKGIFQRASFWDVLMEVAAAYPVYAAYSYRDRADRYTCEFTRDAAERVREASKKVGYSTLRDQIRAGAIARGEFFVER